MHAKVCSPSLPMFWTVGVDATEFAEWFDRKTSYDVDFNAIIPENVSSVKLKQATIGFSGINENHQSSPF